MAVKLKRSAFLPSVYAPLSAEYFVPHAEVAQDLLKDTCRASFPLYMALDAFTVFYKPAEEAAEHLSKPPTTLWQRLIASLYTGWSESAPGALKAMLEVNRITRGSVNLSIVAAVNFLKALLPSRGDGGEEDFIGKLQEEREVRPQERGSWSHRLKQALEEAMKEVEEYAELEAELEAALSGLPGGRGFTHDALSVLRYLARPDDFRRRVTLLRELRRSLEVFSRALPSGGGVEVVESLYGGVSGVSQLRDMRQLFDLVPAELALPPELVALRALTGSAVVRRRAASVRPAVFVDKSGSMTGSMPWGLQTERGGEGGSRSSVPKVSAAAGLALAMWKKYRADVYLFDTEVQAVQPRDVYRVLMLISADGGTRIAEVLREAARLPPARPVVVLTDGIDDPEREPVERAVERGNVTFVLIPPAERRKWMSGFRVVQIESVADLFSWVRGGGGRA